jgi:hypothetical protein
MGTLSEKLAGAVACDGASAKKMVDVRRLSRSALRPKTASKVASKITLKTIKPVNRKARVASHAMGAETIRDVASSSVSR